MRRNVFVAIGEDCWVAICEKPNPAKVHRGHSLERGESSLLTMIRTLEYCSNLFWKATLRVRTDNLLVYSTLIGGFDPPEAVRERLERVKSSFHDRGVTLIFERDTVRDPHPLSNLANDLLKSTALLIPGTVLTSRLDELLAAQLEPPYPASTPVALS